MRRKPPATFVRSTPVLHERVQKKNWECDLPWKSFSSSLSFWGSSSPSGAVAGVVGIWVA
jgi:hypothetical protein